MTHRAGKDTNELSHLVNNMSQAEFTCTPGLLASARRQKMTKARRSKFSSRVEDGRLHCHGTRSDGHPCNYRAKTAAGFCQRHMPAKGDPRLKEQRRVSAIQKKMKSDSALAWFQSNNPRLPPCPACGHSKLCLEDREYFGIFYVLCVNKDCLQRYTLADTVQFLKTGEIPPMWLKAKDKFGRNSIHQQEYSTGDGRPVPKRPRLAELNGGTKTPG